MKKRKFISLVTPSDNSSQPPLWFAFSGSDLLVYEEGAAQILPELSELTELGLDPLRQHFLGTLDGQACYAAEVSPDASAPSNMAFQDLRQLFFRLGDDFSALSGRAVQIVDWDRNHQFCSRCGAKTEDLVGERAKVCPECQLHSYPRLSPSIIVRVRRGLEILLARGHNWPEGFYSVLAGFVEPGETLEETVAREVAEETGIQVQNIRYFGSQPWPFPNSLMLGFTAEYARGDLQIEEAEIADAGWFTIDNLPKLPPRFSISRQLIEDFIEEVSRSEPSR